MIKQAGQALHFFSHMIDQNWQIRISYSHKSFLCKHTCIIWVSFLAPQLFSNLRLSMTSTQTHSIVLPFSILPIVGTWTWQRLILGCVGGCLRTGRNMLQPVLLVHNDILAIYFPRRKLTFTDLILHTPNLNFLCSLILTIWDRHH